ncbi:MAG TPA: phenylalanine--tRNA ligase subunit beta [Desulfobacterales bacterium]|nr:phenylalanine--tRNA ligase subunit beta [Desulfobacterales bacterium]
MRLSINWLKDFVEVAVPPEELADRLTLAGLEVEAVEIPDVRFVGVMVGRVEQVAAHPQADRLKLADVFDGRRRYRVVCGAPNVQAGGLYPFAPVGAVLADGKPLKAVKLRGILSEGMLLAEDELGLSDDHSGLMELPSDLTVGSDLVEALSLRDMVLEVAITPNRPDCLSVLGLAREVSALLDVPLRLPSVELQPDTESIQRWAAVDIEDPENCPRYTARMVVDLQVRPSPFWLRRRLQVSGFRAINNLVDVTNYVLLEYGQPLHAFDFDCLQGGRIIVRRPRTEETRFTTLDGQDRPLAWETLLICDAAVPVAIAGVMGGQASEVTGDTRRVLIESAYFNPPSIRRASKRLGLSSESSYRFERGIDPETLLPALDRAAQLMAEFGGGRILHGLIDVCPRPISRPRLRLRLGRTSAVLGTPLDKPLVSDILRRLQMPPITEDADALTVQVPSYRGDLTREVDLIEEVARLHGYDKIPVTLPRLAMSAARPPKEARLREKARELLLGMGFFEVINYAFQPDRLTTLLEGEDPDRSFVKVANPISEEQAVMRRSLIPGLLQNMRLNAAHFIKDVKIFEIGKTFWPCSGGKLPDEPLMLAGLLTGARTTPAWNLAETALDYYDVKGVVENLLAGLLVNPVNFKPASVSFLCPGALIQSGETVLGWFGEIHPDIAEQFDLKPRAYVFQLDFVLVTAAAKECAHFTPLPRYPAVYRDLAVTLAASWPSDQVTEAIYALGHPWLVEAQLFDVYAGPPVPPGERSLAFHLHYRDPERTLTDEAVDPWHEAVIQGLQEKFGAKLRT